MSKLDKYKALGAQAAAEGADMTKAQTGGGGGGYEPPKAGPCNLRLVGYFEIGKQEGSFQGQPTIRDKVRLVFEVSGKNYPPVETEDGTKIPVRITVEENLSLNSKARFFKLFGVMNYSGKANHMVELLGEAYKGTIVHRKYPKRTDASKTDESTWTGVEPGLYDRNTGSFTISPPRFEVRDEDGEATGEVKTIQVAPAITELKAFLWNYSDLEDWTALYIPGEYPARTNDKGEVTAPAKSKNVLQDAIRGAVNFKGSPIAQLLAAAGTELDLPETKAKPAAKPAAKNAAPVATEDEDDELNGIA